MSAQTVAVRHSQPDSDGPGHRSEAWERQHEAVETCTHVYGGTFALREAGELYLPRQPKEDPDEAYPARLKRSVLFNAFRRTVKGLTGMVYRRAPTIGDDVPETIATHLENIDLAGRDISTFLKDEFRSKTRAGHVCIFVDWSGAEGARRAVDEEGARPYWAIIEKDAVIRFRTENRDGKTVLVSFAYTEDDEEPDGEFQTKPIERVKQYDLHGEGELARVYFRAWTRRTDSQGEWIPEFDFAEAPEGSEPDPETPKGKPLGDRMRKIPVAIDYADRTGYLTSEPPLLDLALENLEHWRVRSERSTALGVCNSPIFAIFGESADDVGTLGLGASMGLALPNPQGRAEWIETQGHGLSASRDELKDIEQRMATLGLSLIVRRPTAPATATAEEIEASEQDSELGASVEGSEDAVAEALALHATWMGEPTGGRIGLNKDFKLKSLSPQMVIALSGMVGAAQLSLESLWDMLEEGEVLPATFDPEVEADRIQTSGTAEMMAAIEAARREATAATGITDDETDDE